MLICDHALLLPSAASHTGWLAAADSALAFLPLTDLVNSTQIPSITTAFDKAVSQPGLSPLQILQYSIQRDWLLRGTVPQAELGCLTKGLVAPAANESYITVLTGILVRSKFDS